jgi:hypothetical protein
MSVFSNGILDQNGSSSSFNDIGIHESERALFQSAIEHLSGSLVFG